MGIDLSALRANNLQRLKADWPAVTFTPGPGHIAASVPAQPSTLIAASVGEMRILLEIRRDYPLWQLECGEDRYSAHLTGWGSLHGQDVVELRGRLDRWARGEGQQ